MRDDRLRHACRLLPVFLTFLTAVLGAGAAAAATLEISGPPGAEVRLADRALGRLPLAAPLQLEPGLYSVDCRLRGYHGLREVVVIAEPDSWVHLRLRPLPLERRHAVTASLLFAGLGQWHLGAKTRGWIYFLGESGGLLTALVSELQRSNLRDDYLSFKASYDTAPHHEIEYWRRRTEEAYHDMLDMTTRRDTGLYVAAGAWILSLLDAWLLFPGVEIGPGLVPPAAAAAPPPAGLHAALTLGF